MVKKITIVKNTPRDTSLVPCSVRKPLNRVARPSVTIKVLTLNSSEVKHQSTPSSNPRVWNVVYVVNQRKVQLKP